jgi:hypothetical protein
LDITSPRFYVRADRRVASVRAPGVEDAAHAGERTFKVFGLLLQQRPDVDTRRRPRTSEGNNVLDLRERQAKSTSLTDEREQLQHVVWIAPVTGFRATRRWQNTARLVQPQGFAAHATALRHLSDQ